MRGFVIGAVLSTWSCVAHAAPQKVDDPAVPEPPTLTAEERQDPASYRGRTNDANAGDALAWIPRALFSPLYVVTEYGIRVPTWTVLAWADRHHVFPILDNILNPTPDISWHPIVAFDLGVFVALGAGLEVRNFLTRSNTVNLTGEGGWPGAWLFDAKDTWKVGAVQFGLRGAAFSRDDRKFYGFGPNSGDVATYFSQRRFEGFVFAGVDVQNHLSVKLSQGFRADRIGPAPEDSIENFFDPKTIPGFGQTNLAMAMADLRLDSRRSPDHSGGARLLTNLTYARDVDDSERRFVSTEVDAEAAVEVSRPDRVLALRGYLMDTFPLGTEPVPLLEQAMLGWKNHLGFTWGRFRDESAVMLELRYHYPVAYFIDMQWITSVGNVFARDFSDFDVKALTTSMGVGLRTRRTGRRPLQLIFALGTTRFDEPFAIQSVRFCLMSTEGL